MGKSYINIADNSAMEHKTKVVNGEICFEERSITRNIIKCINTGIYFKPRIENMNHEISSVESQIDKATDQVTRQVDKMVIAEGKLSESTKKISGKVKDAAHKLSDGLNRIEKAANFDRLERYVALLERAESAMTKLSVLENSGKLDKIATALR